MPAFARPLVRETLTANRTYYVRTDGSDSNDGSANTSANAFLTIQKAIDSVCDLIDTASLDVTIQVGAGTYNAPNTVREYVGRGNVTILGNIASPSSVFVTCSTLNCFLLHPLNAGKQWAIRGFKLSTSGSAQSCLAAQSGTLVFSAIEFGTAAIYHVVALQNGYVVADGDYSISGGALSHIGADQRGVTSINGRTVTLAGTPAFGTAFAVSYRTSVLSAEGVSFTGAATGKRYDASQLALIATGGGGATLFPGSLAGTTNTGGQYV